MGLEMTQVSERLFMIESQREFEKRVTSVDVGIVSRKVFQ